MCQHDPPPPDGFPDRETLIAAHKEAAKYAVLMYADNHDDFFEILMEAALDHLMEDVLTDDLFTPDAGFTPTAEEVSNIDRAKTTAEALDSLFRGLGNFLKHI